MAKRLEEEGPSVLLIAKISSSIGDWLINHIATEDRKIGVHLKSVANV